MEGLLTVMAWPWTRADPKPEKDPLEKQRTKEI